MRLNRTIILRILTLVLSCVAVIYLEQAIVYNMTSSTDDPPSLAVDRSPAPCQRPSMTLWPPYMKEFYSPPPALSCHEATPDWVYVSNGTFYISDLAKVQHGEITCMYQPLERLNDFEETFGESVQPFLNGTPITTDFFKVTCESSDDRAEYTNLHLGIHPQEQVLHRRDNSTHTNPMRLNILMFGLDSMSRLHWLRTLPKTHEYLTAELGGINLEGYNIVGDGTPEALLPILTGLTEEELPEARRGFPGAKSVDTHPWIWSDLKQLGYATQWGEDDYHLGAFTYRMLGFDKPPVDHYLRPFIGKLSKEFALNNLPHCIGSKPQLGVLLDWMKAFFEVYPSIAKFSHIHHCKLSHESLNNVALADNLLKLFLVDMYSSGHLNNTILILMSDHGPRFASIREHEQGKYEERLPYFTVRLPEWFALRFPRAAANLRRNGKMLTTPFDIHETFQDIINYTQLSSVNGQRGISLFQHIPADRTCDEASIPVHYCTCMDWKIISGSDHCVLSAAQHLETVINNITSPQRYLCQLLTLHTIVSAMKYSTKQKLREFKQSVQDENGNIVPDFSDDTRDTLEHYQITVIMYPGGAKFEATMRHEEERYDISRKEISRINRYGKQSYCVSDSYPHMAPFCYCTTQLK